MWCNNRTSPILVDIASLSDLVARDIYNFSMPVSLNSFVTFIKRFRSNKGTSNMCWTSDN